jgi:plasmid maintenance system antidote protein VapI
MSPTDIKIILLKNGLDNISALAEELGCKRQELSMLINGKRYYPLLQEKLAKKLNKTQEQLFGNRARKAA